MSDTDDASRTDLPMEERFPSGVPPCGFDTRGQYVAVVRRALFVLNDESLRPGRREEFRFIESLKDGMVFVEGSYQKSPGIHRTATNDIGSLRFDVQGYGGEDGTVTQEKAPSRFDERPYFFGRFGSVIEWFLAVPPQNIVRVQIGIRDVVERKKLRSRRHRLPSMRLQ
ncbi:hypothetical protein HAL_24500 [Haladaptatus sp. T7]|nr:hypothetical protein HAL_24500 [Haladaptatus sp. T7]